MTAMRRLSVYRQDSPGMTTSVREVVLAEVREGELEWTADS
jgi:hypothetical protein